MPNCNTCGEELNEYNWPESLRKKNSHKCHQCYNEYHRQRYHKKDGSVGRPLTPFTRMSGNFNNDIIRLCEHLNNFCDHYQGTIPELLGGLIEWREQQDSRLEDLAKSLKLKIDEKE